ncbi:MAG: hypothetical protein H6Q69_2115 [Firmicutes bacterium]|nr:hypothetical protein [Bacillota bacterium]
MLQEDRNMTREQKQVKLLEAFVVRILSNHHAFHVLLDAEERTSILTKTAPSFFNTLNDLLQRDFFLECAKILEPCTSRVKGEVRENLTVNLFVERTGWTNEQQVRLNEFRDRLQRFYPWIKDARNKIIGHNDLLTYENEQSDGLGAFQEGLDVEFVETLEEFYNYLHEISFGRIWGAFAANVEPGSVYELITAMYHALAFDAVVNDERTPINEKNALD